MKPIPTIILLLFSWLNLISGHNSSEDRQAVQSFLDSNPVNSTHRDQSIETVKATTGLSINYLCAFAITKLRGHTIHTMKLKMELLNFVYETCTGFPALVREAARFAFDFQLPSLPNYFPENIVDAKVKAFLQAIQPLVERKSGEPNLPLQKWFISQKDKDLGWLIPFMDLNISSAIQNNGIESLKQFTSWRYDNFEGTEFASVIFDGTEADQLLQLDKRFIHKHLITIYNQASSNFNPTREQIDTLTAISEIEKQSPGNIEKLYILADWTQNVELMKLIIPEYKQFPFKHYFFKSHNHGALRRALMSNLGCKRIERVISDFLPAFFSAGGLPDFQKYLKECEPALPDENFWTALKEVLSEGSTSIHDQINQFSTFLSYCSDKKLEIPSEWSRYDFMLDLSEESFNRAFASKIFSHSSLSKMIPEVAEYWIHRLFIHRNEKANSLLIEAIKNDKPYISPNMIRNVFPLLKEGNSGNPFVSPALAKILPINDVSQLDHSSLRTELFVLPKVVALIEKNQSKALKLANSIVNFALISNPSLSLFEYDMNLWEFAVKISGDFNLISVVKNSNTHDEMTSSVLEFAISKSPKEKRKELLELLILDNQHMRYDFGKTWAGESLLHLAARYNWIKVLSQGIRDRIKKSYLSHSFTLTNNEHRSPIMVAAYGGEETWPAFKLLTNVLVSNLDILKGYMEGKNSRQTIFQELVLLGSQKYVQEFINQLSSASPDYLKKHSFCAFDWIRERRPEMAEFLLYNHRYLDIPVDFLFRVAQYKMKASLVASNNSSFESEFLPLLDKIIISNNDTIGKEPVVLGTGTSLAQTFNALYFVEILAVLGKTQLLQQVVARPYIAGRTRFTENAMNLFHILVRRYFSMASRSTSKGFTAHLNNLFNSLVVLLNYYGESFNVFQVDVKFLNAFDMANEVIELYPSNEAIFKLSTVMKEKKVERVVKMSQSMVDYTK